MSAPSQTFFCENGHRTASIPHGYEAESDPSNIPCSECDSSNIRCVLNWQDPDYESGYKVPAKPLRVEKKRRTVPIPIYDVSLLFGEENHGLR